MSSDETTGTAADQTTDSAQEPRDDRPFADSFGVISPIRVRVVSVDEVDSIVIDFEYLEHYRLGGLLLEELWNTPVNPDSIVVDGNTVTFPVPDNQDADEMAVTLARQIGAKYRYAAVATVEPKPSTCICGNHPSGGFRAILDLSAVVDQAEGRRLSEVLKETLAVEGIEVLSHRQRLYFTPTKFYAGDVAAVRRMIVRVAKATGIEIIGDITVEEEGSALDLASALAEALSGVGGLGGVFSSVGDFVSAFMGDSSAPFTGRRWR